MHLRIHEAERAIFDRLQHRHCDITGSQLNAQKAYLANRDAHGIDFEIEYQLHMMEPQSMPPSDETSFYLTIRFTTSDPDLDLDVPNPSKATVVQLKQQIRSAIPSSLTTKRLRLISGGKILQDGSILSTVLKQPPPPPPPDAKGKSLEKPQPRIYINCSIGETLTPSELADEQSTRRVPSPIPTPNQPPTTAPLPQGFDRLLNWGFSAAEVATLRSQFMAIQAASHTPDTMPSATALRQMEDAWLDENGNGGGEMMATAEAADLDDFFWGAFTGFLWPMGSLGWMGREEGLWSERRRMAVWTGALTAMVFGIMRMIGS